MTLLCWHVLTSEDLAGRSHADLVRLAHQFDPENTVLAAEIRELRVSGAVLGYVDDLVERRMAQPTRCSASRPDVSNVARNCGSSPTTQ